MINCPNCKNKLKSIDFKGIKLDECENCKGKWFDRDELRKAKDSADNYLRWLDFDLFDEKSNKFLSSQGLRKCPNDNAAMTLLTYADSKVIIDKCSTCNSVFLDNKEFEKIIFYLENVLLSKPARAYPKEVIKEFSEIFIGTENTVSEIKDFLSVLNFFSMRYAVEHPWVTKMSENIYKYWPIK